MLDQQRGQRADRLGLRRLAAAAVKTRAGERDRAERGAEVDRVWPLAAPWPAADRAAPMPGRIARRLGRDQALLNAGQQRLGLGERQAERLQPVVTLVEQQKLGVVADHALVLRDNPELNLDTHAHPISGDAGETSLAASAVAGYPRLPRVLHALLGPYGIRVNAV